MDVMPTPVEAGPPGWRPAGELADHSGRQLDVTWDFFAAPPAEIGALRSAHTTLRAGAQPRSTGKRLSYLFLSLLIGVGVSAVVRQVLDHPLYQPLVIVGVMLAALLIGLWAFANSRFRHTCTFVGADGVAQASLIDARENPPTVQLFLFRDAAELRTSETRHYLNGAYQGTNYNFRWTDGQGKARFLLHGRYNGENKPPKPDDAYHFASAAEVAWSINLLDHLQEQLDRQGFVQFNAGGRDFVRLAPGKMEFHFKGRTETMTPDDVKQFNIGKGVFSVRHKDARWFGSAGKFDFQYGNLANAKLFLLSLDKLVGLKF